MVPRPILIRANLKGQHHSGFSRWKMFLCTNLSQNPLRRRVRTFSAFLILGSNVYNVVEADF